MKYLNILYESITIKLEPSLKKYIDSKIIPMYKKHDRAHNETHAKEVITDSFKISNLVKGDLDANILYASAALHDVGIRVSRDNHNMHSSKIIRKLKTLKKWFSDDDIEIIAQVAEDHRASLKITPRSIYGKIVSDADKCSLLSAERLMVRLWVYRVDTIGSDTDETVFEDMFEYMNMKFGSKKGYAKLHLKETYKLFKKGIDRTIKICDNKNLAYDLFLKMRKDGRLKR